MSADTTGKVRAMTAWLTMTGRKQARLAALRDVLSAYGYAQGGRFVLYGPAARGDPHSRSVFFER